MKKFLLYFIIFAAIGTVITVTGLTLVENFVYSLNQSSTTTPLASESESQSQVKKASTITLEENISNLEFSYDNEYYTYLKDSKIYINNIEDGKNVDIIEEELPICYCKLLYDKNLIIYFTQNDNGRTTSLQLKTYQIETKRKSEYNKFNVSNFSCIKDMNMSPVVNILYINVETKSGTYTNNIIYRIDLFNSMSRVKSGIIINEMIMLQHKDRIYYEDEDSNIYRGNSRIRIFDEDVVLIGIDYDDNLYFISKEEKNVVYKVKNDKIVDTIELSDTNLVKTYTNNVGVYIVYPNYVINVASEEPYKRLGKLSNYVEFLAIRDNMMYLKTKNNQIIKTEIIESY